MVTTMCNYVPPENDERARCECGSVMPIGFKGTAQAWWISYHMGKGK